MNWKIVYIKLFPGVKGTNTEAGPLLQKDKRGGLAAGPHYALSPLIHPAKLPKNKF